MPEVRRNGKEVSLAVVTNQTVFLNFPKVY